MMTLKDVLNFYFSQYDTIDLHVKMINGLEGKSHIVTRNDINFMYSGWGDCEVVSFGGQTYYTSLNQLGQKMENFTAWITIKE